jgi:hypothetical protein
MAGIERRSITEKKADNSGVDTTTTEAISVQVAGRRGGQATLERYGSKFFRAIGPERRPKDSTAIP